MYQSKVCDNPSCSDIFAFQPNFFNILLLLRAYLKSCPGLSFTNIILTFLLIFKDLFFTIFNNFFVKLTLLIF